MLFDSIKKAIQKVQAIPILKHKMISDYPYFLEFDMDGKTYEIEYKERILNLVFRAALTCGGITQYVIVKFASQYGYDAHFFVKGFSPNIIYHTYAPPWHIVHMEKSTDTKVAVCKFLDFIPRYVP